jgi:hypothetical protein
MCLLELEIAKGIIKDRLAQACCVAMIKELKEEKKGQLWTRLRMILFT